MITRLVNMIEFQLSLLDQRLLAMLQENARISTAELARSLGVTRSTVQGHMKNLERTGIIRGYTVTYDETYSQQLVSAHVLITVIQKLTARTTRELTGLHEVKSLDAVSGDYDMIAIVQTTTTEALSQLLDRISNLEGVERTNSSLILENKFSR